MEKVQLGVLGLGSRTTSYYLSELNALYNNKKGGYSTCPLLLYNVDFNSINALLPNASSELDLVTQDYLKRMDAFQCQNIIIPNITLHETVDRLKINANILHPIHLTIAKLKVLKCTKIVLFGSLFSMQSKYITSHFKSHGIEVVLPSESDMNFIDTVRIQVYNQTETTEVIKKYHLLINKYSAKYPVVLGCTELSILKPLNTKDLIDMAQLQIEAAVFSMQ
ncbi:aspartate/glutamate racemase family protein [Formosa sp. L2A11]|uniref:aspartate/glutamate racemase family protein n=1 Tax=Formosa sp. L2A11 TaxID=2686363 RepID=UPI00131C5E3E|nr:aspartate/glutamate racemase family protein [Formosa sp. L2A11]